ncbi:hypothetical protein LCGC14_2207640 [marine sediment metagenome]|uniref:Heparin-sulfate lyase N-terminal domain-containing protein n=1 Tax=marine sediment metagenome TaxID=412755 RepID=A0A0F9E267_9ZZZZ
MIDKNSIYIQDIIINLKKLLNRNLEFISSSYTKSKSKIFYGHSFLLSLKNYLEPNIYDLISKQTLHELKKKDQTVHLEFLKTAIGLNSLVSPNQNEKLKILKKFALKAGYRNNSTTNWILLKLLAQTLLHENYDGTEIFSKLLIFLRKDSSNFIRDNCIDFSLQYHWFIIWELAKIYQFSLKKYYLKQYLKTIGLAEKLILSNARLSYFGRGQEQLFSYGASVYAFSFKYFLLREEKTLAFLKDIVSFLLSIQEKNGYIPLIISKNRTPKNFGVFETPLNKTKFKNGWYRYNNFWDYFLFFTYTIYDSIRLLSRINTKNVLKTNFTYNNPSIPNFLQKFDLNNDLSIFYLKLGRKLSQDLFFPYVVYNNRFLIPIPGGEEYKNPYDIHLQASYPYLRVKDEDITLIKRNNWVFNKNVGKISTKFFNFKRTINLNNKKRNNLDISIIDEIKLNRISPNMELYSVNIPLWSKLETNNVLLEDQRYRISIEFPSGFKISKKKVFTPLGEAFRYYVKEEKLKWNIKKKWNIQIKSFN